MADLSLSTPDDCMDDSDEGVFEQGDCPTTGPGDDLTLPPLLRVQRYARSENIFDRQMVARVVQEIFRTMPPESLAQDLPEIMKVLTKIADESILRADLLEQIPHIAAQAIECSTRVSALKNIVSEYLIPLVVRNLGCADTAVDKAAHSTLIQLIEQGFISKQQAEIQVCPSILALSKVECLADINTGAITLMSKIAPLLGRDVTERVFLQRFAELCTNHMFYVRKVCASHFGDFCAVVGKESFENILLPTYIELCQDEIWGVRKSCAEVVMFVSCACPPIARRSTLAPVFAKLLQDECKWVRISAFQTLGPFIATFAEPSITSIGYNTFGDLVLVNGDGSEFLINTPSIPDNRCSTTEKFKYLLLCNDKDEDVVMNPLGVSLIYDESQTLNNEDSANKEEYVEIPNEKDNLCTVIDKVTENVTSNSVPPENENEKGDVEKTNIKTNINNPKAMRDDSLDIDFTELAKKVSSLVNNKSFSNQVDCNSNIGKSNLGNDNNNCNGPEIQINSDNTKINEDKQVILNNSESEKEDNFHLYNSYNYWYISPDLPLDPILIESSRSDLGKGEPLYNLVDLYSAISLDDTVNDSPNCSGSEECSSSTNNNNGNELDVKTEAEKIPEQDVVPQLLIDHFISMTDPTLAVNIDNEMTYHCAYSLPAVALTLGSKNWHLLKNTVECLASDMQYKVRRTVASGLHELALILGPEIATSNLTPLFNGFIKDLDEVRIGVLKHLAHFLRLINPAQRNTYLPRLAEFLQTDNEWNWRFRQELAKQLLLAVTLFRACDAAKYIGAIGIELLCDKVAAVRQVALLLITEVVKCTSSEQILTKTSLIKLAEKFAHSKKWQQRQTFALLCSEFLASDALPLKKFASEVMPHLLDLSWDPVPNVRLVVARTLAKQIITNDYFTDPENQHYDGLERILRKLQADEDRDVRQSAEVELKTPMY